LYWLLENPTKTGLKHFFWAFLILNEERFRLPSKLKITSYNAQICWVKEVNLVERVKLQVEMRR